MAVTENDIRKDHAIRALNEAMSRAMVGDWFGFVSKCQEAELIARATLEYKGTTTKREARGR